MRSREASFYYAHPRNRFWKILAAVFEDGVPEETEAKQAFLIRHRVALYDVIESCRITGSSDSSIRDVTVTDLRPVLAGSGVGDRVFANGARAFDLYMRWQYPVTGIRPDRNPSGKAAFLVSGQRRLAAGPPDRRLARRAEGRCVNIS